MDAEPIVYMLVIVYTGPLDPKIDEAIEKCLKKEHSEQGYIISRRKRDLVFDYDSSVAAGAAGERLKIAFPFLDIQGVYSSDELEKL